MKLGCVVGWRHHRLLRRIQVHTLRLRLAQTRGALGNCTELVEHEIADAISRQHRNDTAAVSSVLIDRTFVDTCLNQAAELSSTISVLESKFQVQKRLVRELTSELDKLRQQNAQLTASAAPPDVPACAVDAAVPKKLEAANELIETLRAQQQFLQLQLENAANNTAEILKSRNALLSE